MGGIFYFLNTTLLTEQYFLLSDRVTAFDAQDV